MFTHRFMGVPIGGCAWVCRSVMCVGVPNDVHASGRYTIGSVTSDGGRRVEQDPLEWMASLRKCVTDLATRLSLGTSLPPAEYGASPNGIANRVAAIALSGQMQDLILLDDSYTPLRPAILYVRV